MARAIANGSRRLQYAKSRGRHSLGEIRTGIDRLRTRNAAQTNVFARRLGELHTGFAGRIVPVDTRVADQWGRLNAVARRSGVDSLIAATAQVHELIVATRNTKDFQGCEVPLFDPWQCDLPES
jgi:predicted nucleic acid-binding protein